MMDNDGVFKLIKKHSAEIENQKSDNGAYIRPAAGPVDLEKHLEGGE